MHVARGEPPSIEGLCDRRFAAVRDAFASNFVERGEVGAAVAVSVAGRVVVDLWGGWADARRRRPWRRETLVDFFSVGVAEHSYGPDRVLERPSRFALGFQLTQPERPLGPNAGAFGHFGAGGSLGFCDPEADLAFGYVMNDMGPRWQNPRNRALIDAVYACL